mmetsp:Transcript_17374/g.17461  ORF Transcript_17374/g.17461 Transcript_17374/m.17461 type:complete len:217 (+) Transcript_17374:210-860(+)
MRGGRGGGRFGKVSLTQDLVRDNMEDLGIDQRQLMADLNRPPDLFPPMSMQAPSRLSDEEQFCVQKMRDITTRFQLSPYYLARKTEENDIERYSDRIRKKAKTTAGLLECINTSSDDAARYIPFELLDGSEMGGRLAGTMNSSVPVKSKDLNLSKLEEQERAGGQDATGGNKGQNEGSDLEDEEEAEADWELDADYGVDHYASDNDHSGDDNEAVF